MKKLGIVGSRSIQDYLFVKSIVTDLVKIRNYSTIVSGGAVGIDSIAEMLANEYNKETQIFLPDWKKHPRSAGMLRNGTIVENSDTIVAVWDGQSNGTADTIRKAKFAGKELFIILIDIAYPKTPEGKRKYKLLRYQYIKGNS